ncbi:MAG: hypothetical protein WC326_06560 [Candidatus Delongbacteria bacterium]
MTGHQVARMGSWILRFGALSLAWRTWQLLSQSLRLGLRPLHLLWLLPVAVLAGWLKARLVMRPRMLQNARRLLDHPGRLRPWQLYPPQLFAFILSMVLLMAWLRSVVLGLPLPTALLGGVDLLVAAALLTSSGVYAQVERERRDTPAANR